MKSAARFLAAVLSLHAVGAQAGQDVVIFDTDTLKNKGISDTVADYFSKAPRFAPGTNYVGLYVNGVKLGTTSVTFDGEGQLCVDRALLDRAGIAWADAKEQKTTENTCLDLHKAWPTATVTLRPGLNQVELLVPPQALTATGPAPIYVSGGHAAMLNYRLFDVRNTGLGQGSNMFYADLESGLNVGDWVLRSQDLYSGQDGSNTFQHVQAYAQKTFVPYKSTLQLGQLNLNSPLFFRTVLHRCAGVSGRGVSAGQQRHRRLWHCANASAGRNPPKWRTDLFHPGASRALYHQAGATAQFNGRFASNGG